ncbi:MAG: uroporphyrinogen decarboxylase, partial [Rhodospirillaceae bacterium]|nr:uroporphyrinogen decarboxylase [Rhodospirillaceae bacterium]
MNTPKVDTAGIETGEKLLVRALRGETLPRPPIWLMRQAGRYLPEYRAVRAKAGSFLDLCYNPEFAVEVTLQPIRRFGFDAAILFSDILVVPNALGQDVRFEEGRGPLLEALENDAALERLAMDQFHTKLRPVYATVAGIREALPPETALIGFAGAPWTVASYMIEGGSSKDFARTKAWAYQRPESFQRLVNLLVEATAQYLIAQIEAGAEVLQLFDSWASALDHAGLLQWSYAPMKAIVDRVRMTHPDVPVIVFPRGCG